VYGALGLPRVPPELRETPFRGEPPDLVELGDIRGDLHMHTTWSDGRASVEEMGRAARELGYEYVAICDHTTNVRVVPGLDAEGPAHQPPARERARPRRGVRGCSRDRSRGRGERPPGPARLARRARAASRRGGSGDRLLH